MKSVAGFRIAEQTLDLYRERRPAAKLKSKLISALAEPRLDRRSHGSACERIFSITKPSRLGPATGWLCNFRQSRMSSNVGTKPPSRAKIVGEHSNCFWTPPHQGWRWRTQKQIHQHIPVARDIMAVDAETGCDA